MMGPVRILHQKARTAQKNETMNVNKPHQPNTLERVRLIGGHELDVIRSKMTLIVRDKPYFDLPIVRA